MSKRASQKKAFSLIEVLFAISFLVMVGFAMVSLNAAATKLIDSAELKAVSASLNEESLTVVALLHKTDSNFSQTLLNNNCGTSGCYIDCPAEPLGGSCSFSATPKPIQLGRNRLQFIRKVLITDLGASRYNVVATTSWGSGISKAQVVSQVIE